MSSTLGKAVITNDLLNLIGKGWALMLSEQESLHDEFMNCYGMEWMDGMDAFTIYIANTSYYNILTSKPQLTGCTSSQRKNSDHQQAPDIYELYR